MVESSSSTRLPAWLESLLSEKFFNPCMIHEDARKNEKNIFCVDCCDAICHHCLDIHNSHRLLQIRRYVYHDVIRVGDAEKLMDCSYVQAYTTNSAKVVFLNQRPQTRACRNLNFMGSSLIHHIMSNEGMVSEYLHECEILTLPEPGSDEWLMSPDTIIEPFVSLRTVAYATTTEIVRKKRTSKFEIPAASSKMIDSPVSETTINRRKGMPRRSPFN
ncbi:hypothetical protein R6Q59_021647 [Mikania micrantha]